MKKFLDGKLLCATKNNLLIYKKGYLLFCNLNEPEKVIKQVKIQGLCGKINALARLGGIEPGELPKSMAAAGINDKPGFAALFSSHPPIEQRIAALQNSQNLQ